MRTAFIEELCKVAGKDDRIWLLCADIGFSVLERFADRFPDRYVNVGVAEQNMTGIAAGLALSGKIVFTYSIANFPTLRCLEQIRSDVCYHNANVKIVAVGGGLAYGAQGYTHHGLEDIAIMRSLPNMTVVAPADPIEARLATRSITSSDGPAYLRLGRANEPVLHSEEPDFASRQVIPMRHGEDALILSTGGMLETALLVQNALAASGVDVSVWSCPWLKPLDRESIEVAARRFPIILTLEEAQVTGGLGGAVAEVVAEATGARARVVRAGANDAILKQAYSQKAGREQLGLGVKELSNRLKDEIDASVATRANSQVTTVR